MTDASVRSVSVRFGQHTALDSVSIVFTRGTLTALIGPNGAGKSTLLRVLAGLLRPDEGDAVVSGRIGLVLQQTAVDHLLTVRENLRFFVDVHGGDPATVDSVIELSGLQDRADDRVGTLSGGLIRRVDLARAVCTDPAVLLLDEPTAGLDAGSRRDFAGLVRRITTERQMTTVWVTHHPDELQHADRIVTIEGGRVTGDEAIDPTGRVLPDCVRIRVGDSESRVVTREAALESAADAIAEGQAFSCGPVEQGTVAGDGSAG